MALRTALVLALAGALVGACASSATPSAGEPALPSSGSGVPTASEAASPTAEPTPTPPTPSLAPSPTPPPAAKPAPTPPAGPLARVAVVEQDGVRVKIELERNPLPAGEVTRVTTTVRNLGRRALHWLSDGCATAVHVTGEAATGWRPGATHASAAQAFKERVLDWAYRPAPHPGPWIAFRPESWLGGGAYGCADLGIVHDIAPGAAIRDVRAWDGLAYLRWGPFPAGPVTLAGTFRSYWRGRHEPEEGTGSRRIEVKLEAWVTGGADETWLSPPEVVDAALTDREFLAWVESLGDGSGVSELAWYRPELGAWEVGGIRWADGPGDTMHLVLVDPHTGAILDTVDRPWDEDRDGVP